MTAVRNFILTFILSLLIFGVIAFGLVRFTTSAFELGVDRTEGTDTGESEQTQAPDETTPDVTPEDWLSLKGESFTVLLVGIDYQPDVYDDYDVSEDDKTPDGFPKEPRIVEADSITLVRVNKETGECLFCPIPAISKITVDGLPYQLQHLYGLKGLKAVADKVMAMTGIPIDYYAAVNMSSFASLIDDLGGITFYVPADMHYEDASLGIKINLRRGSQKLNGKKAVDMLRYWSYDDGDTSRRKVAVSFLKELFKKLASQITSEDAVVAFVRYSKYFETNFNSQDLVDHIDLILSYNKMNITDYTYPGTTVIDENGEATFTPNIQKAMQDFAKFKYKG